MQETIKIKEKNENKGVKNLKNPFDRLIFSCKDKIKK